MGQVCCADDVTRQCHIPWAGIGEGISHPVRLGNTTSSISQFTAIGHWFVTRWSEAREVVFLATSNFGRMQLESLQSPQLCFPDLSKAEGNAGEKRSAEDSLL